MTVNATLLLSPRQISSFGFALVILAVLSCNGRQDSASDEDQQDGHSNMRKSEANADSHGASQHGSSEGDIVDASSSPGPLKEKGVPEGRSPVRKPSSHSSSASTAESHASGRATPRGKSTGIDASQARDASHGSRVDIENAEIAETRGKELLAEAGQAADDDDSAEAFRAARKAWEITRAFPDDPECQAITRRALKLTEIHGEAVNRSVGYSSDGKRVTVE